MKKVILVITGLFVASCASTNAPTSNSYEANNENYNPGARVPSQVTGNFGKLNMKCAVVEVTNDSPFDEGLQREKDGDEDYSYVNIVSQKSKQSVRIGGFNFPRKKGKVKITQTPARVRAEVKDSSFGNLLVTYDYTNGRGYVYTVSAGKETEVASINCLSGTGINPFEQTPIHW